MKFSCILNLKLLLLFMKAKIFFLCLKRKEVFLRGVMQWLYWSVNVAPDLKQWDSSIRLTGIQLPLPTDLLEILRTTNPPNPGVLTTDPIWGSLCAISRFYYSLSLLFPLPGLQFLFFAFLPGRFSTSVLVVLASNIEESCW